jgi:hypothetical protein
MFERLVERVGRAAERRASEKVREMDAELRDELPPGIGCEAGKQRVVISGRGLLRRYLLDAALRSTIGRGR